jgi:hypothetical protein
MRNYHEVSTERLGALCGALFLVGLALLFQLDWIWPGILPLIWITAAPLLIAELGWQLGLWVLAQTAIWTAGLPLLFRFDRIWPGVLALAGLSALLVAIAPPDQLTVQRGDSDREYNSTKRKRGLPLPPLEQYGPFSGDGEDAPEAVAPELSGNHRSARPR